MDFTLDLPVRIVFGTGRRGDLAAELERLGITRPMLCCTPGGAARYAELGALCAGIFARAEPHCPEPVAMAALDAFRKLNADGVVLIGGGSTIGLGKVIAAETGAPSLVLPTTYSGSELTPLYGMLVGDEKRTKRDERCLAKSVIYDPELTLTLSPHVTATSGMNGLAHCVEAPTRRLRTRSPRSTRRPASRRSRTACPPAPPTGMTSTPVPGRSTAPCWAGRS